jgi:outer membrane protein OmpA-like peptidoglycan-associated protein
VRPGEGAWTNYDFIPGTRVLFADDFTQETVGNFPRRLAHKGGAAEVVEWAGPPLALVGRQDAFVLTLPSAPPSSSRWSSTSPARQRDGRLLRRPLGALRAAPDGADHLAFGTWFADLRGPGRSSTTSTGRKTDQEVVRARIMADGEYVKVFVNERRVVNVPNAKLGRSKQIYVFLNGWSAEAPRMIGDVRIAAGGRKLYDALAEKGRVATQGVLFATASAEVRPESGPTLKEIAAMLAEHPELKLTIEGHTDNAATRRPTRRSRRRVPRPCARRWRRATGWTRRGSRPAASARPGRPPRTPRPRGAPPNRRVELVRR